MLISTKVTNNCIVFSLLIEDDDYAHAPKKVMQESFYFRGENYDFSNVHPDRMALVAILNTLPFAGKRIFINWDISSAFLSTASKIITRVKIESKSSNYVPISLSSDGVPALSFSGGADSMAALSIMPNNTEPVFMLRGENKKIKSLYNPEAAIKSCYSLRNLGYDVHIIESDLEFLRDPLGFPTDLAVASPIILLANFLKFNSVSFGTILESAYGTSGTEFRNYLHSSHYKLWNTLFESAGLYYSLPVAGISEVGTEIILNNSPLGNFYQSCIRGEWKNPCKKCWKCFRKGLLNYDQDNPNSEKEILFMLNISKEVKQKLTGPHIRHEGVLTYSLTNISSNDIRINNLKKLVRVDEIPIKWMNKWYYKSANLMPENFRESSTDNIKKYLQEMPEEDISNLESWSIKESDKRKKWLKKFKQSVGL